DPDLLDADPNVLKEKLKAKIKEDCRESCEAYANDWIKKIAPCNFSPTHTDMLIAELVEICGNTCDEVSPFGSSKSNIPTLNNNRSFEEAFRWIMDLGGYTYSAACNPEVFVMPNNTVLPPSSMEYKPLDECA